MVPMFPMCPWTSYIYPSLSIVLLTLWNQVGKLLSINKLTFSTIPHPFLLYHNLFWDSWHGTLITSCFPWVQSYNLHDILLYLNFNLSRPLLDIWHGICVKYYYACDYFWKCLSIYIHSHHGNKLTILWFCQSWFTVLALIIDSANLQAFSLWWQPHSYTIVCLGLAYGMFYFMSW